MARFFRGAGCWEIHIESDTNAVMDGFIESILVPSIEFGFSGFYADITGNPGDFRAVGFTQGKKMPAFWTKSGHHDQLGGPCIVGGGQGVGFFRA